VSYINQKQSVMNYFIPLFCWVFSSPTEEYPDPRIVIVGPTAQGLARVPWLKLFLAATQLIPRMSVCLKSAMDWTPAPRTPLRALGPGLEMASSLRLLTLLGLETQMKMTMNKYIEEMINMLDNKLGYANTILLVLEGSVPRFSNSLYAMLRQMTSIFGETWWDFMMIGVSKWEYSQGAMDKRNQTCTIMPDNCRDEAWFRREFNAQFQAKFGINKTFTFAFIFLVPVTAGYQ